MALQIAVTIQAISKAVEAGAKVWNTWLASADKRRLVKRIRRLNKAIDAAEEIFAIQSRMGRYEKVKPETAKRYIAKYQKIFRKFNQ